MFNRKKRILLMTAALLLVATSAPASQCVDCHTDVAKLKVISETLPKPLASAETAGKG